jgi:hypothetical protein
MSCLLQILISNLDSPVGDAFEVTKIVSLDLA